MARTFKNFLKRVPPGWEPKDYIIHILTRHKYSLKNACADLGYTSAEAAVVLCKAYGVKTGITEYYKKHLPEIIGKLQEGKTGECIAEVLGIPYKSFKKLCNDNDVWHIQYPLVMMSRYGYTPAWLSITDMSSITGISVMLARHYAGKQRLSTSEWYYRELVARGREVCIFRPAGYSFNFVMTLLKGDYHEYS